MIDLHILDKKQIIAMHFLKYLKSKRCFGGKANYD